MAKKHQRHAAPPRQTRTRTRRDKGAALVSDPIENTQKLNEHLRARGLYAAPTLGDGNCLFRALSDQYYGSPSLHLKLREEICDWIEDHRQRYEPFVLDERGFDVHLRCMRQQGTYGGHLELTAFAHLNKRDVKVIQPNLVYVIEWRVGGDMSPTSPKAPSLPASPDIAQNERDARRMRRGKKRELKDKVAKAKQAARSAAGEDEEEDEEDAELGAVYVAYHDWEHFSSVRNLTGPHSGLPFVVEKPIIASQAGGRQNFGNKPTSSESSQSSMQSSSMDYDAEEVDEGASPADLPPPAEDDDVSAENVPLPCSRSSSPSPTSEASTSGSSSLAVPLLPGYNCPPNPKEASQVRRLSLRINRSPKRAYDDAEETAEDSQGEAKRSRRVLRLRLRRGNTLGKEDKDIDPDADTPDLTSSGESGSASSSPAATPPPSMVVVPPSPVTPAQKLTRRQRKLMGLPKPRSVSGANKSVLANRSKGAGKVVVPGGQYKEPSSTSAKVKPEDEDEWEKNGTGRVDVRGFKELRI